MDSGKIVVSCHQPNFLPYLGFFAKMKESDIFVIRDEVLFANSDYHHRNRIRVNGADNENNPQCKWLTLPVQDPHDYLMHVPIKRDTQQKKKYWNELILQDIKSHYGKAPNFQRVFPDLQKIFDNSDNRLIDLNMKLIRYFAEKLGVKTKIIMASELGLKGEHYEKSDASEDLAQICQMLGAHTYLSGSGGKEYLNLEPFHKRGIEVKFQEYHHPTYKQAWAGFLPNMACLDAIMCCDEDILSRS